MEIDPIIPKSKSSLSLTRKSDVDLHALNRLEMIRRWEKDHMTRMYEVDRRSDRSTTIYKITTKESSAAAQNRSSLLMLAKYFSLRSVLIMVALTVSLLLLPLILPPLPPPPSTLLLVPVMIMVLLVLLALSPPDVPGNYVAFASV